MSLAQKLDLKGGELRVIGKPPELNLDVPSTTGEGEGVIVFVRTLIEVGTKCLTMVEAAKADKLAWIAYPKAGQLGTDLNRDILIQHMARQGIRGVREVTINDVWNAVRFRPKE